MDDMDVSKNRGALKGMVKIMENPIKMDDLEGKTHHLRKHPYGFKVLICSDLLT